MHAACSQSTRLLHTLLALHLCRSLYTPLAPHSCYLLSMHTACSLYPLLPTHTDHSTRCLLFILFIFHTFYPLPTHLLALTCCLLPILLALHATHSSCILLAFHPAYPLCTLLPLHSARPLMHTASPTHSLLFALLALHLRCILIYVLYTASCHTCCVRYPDIYAACGLPTAWPASAA